MSLNKDMTPAEVRAAWADRLEANPERQGAGQLAPAPDKRCCLGELCDMAVEAGVIKRYSSLASFPCPQVQRWAGLRTPEGRYISRNGSRPNLARDNDGSHSWPQIAATIRAEPEGLVSA